MLKLNFMHQGSIVHRDCSEGVGSKDLYAAEVPSVQRRNSYDCLADKNVATTAAAANNRFNHREGVGAAAAAGPKNGSLDTFWK